MSLLNIIKKQAPKQELIEEDLSAEEIRLKIREMDYDIAVKYLRSLPLKKRRELIIPMTEGFFRYEKGDNKRCLKKYGVSSATYYDTYRH